jgi:uncharacterized protein (DUF1786 family)
MQALLEQFFNEEASSYVRSLILMAVQEHEWHPDVERRKFEFNRFEITLDFIGDFALIEDVLDPAPSGEVRVKLGDFLGRLSAKKD